MIFVPIGIVWYGFKRQFDTCDFLWMNLFWNKVIWKATIINMVSFSSNCRSTDQRSPGSVSFRTLILHHLTEILCERHQMPFCYRMFLIYFIWSIHLPSAYTTICQSINTMPTSFHMHCDSPVVTVIQFHIQQCNRWSIK